MLLIEIRIEGQPKYRPDASSLDVRNKITGNLCSSKFTCKLIYEIKLYAPTVKLNAIN